MEIIDVTMKRSQRPSYRVRIENGLLDRLPELLTRGRLPGRLFVITDSTVKMLYGEKLLAALLTHGIDAWLLDFPPGEASKNPHVALALSTQLLEHGVERSSTIVTLGGGVVGDVGGYVAATLLRGIAYLHVPTTLLSQADSCIGGKVGIDHPLGKNLIGSFHHPRAVFIDPSVLRTLPEAEFRSGLGEVVKMAATLDREFFSFLRRHARRIRKDDPEVLKELITRSVRMKVDVVRQDEREEGLRKVLNAGHTIGHALEASSGYSMRHGDAVAIGLAAEARIARLMGVMSRADCDRLLRLMRSLRLKTALPRLRNRRRFHGALALDKKRERRTPKFVLLTGIGSCLVGVDVPTPFIEALAGRKNPGRKPL